jgi:hypothetical protein
MGDGGEAAISKAPTPRQLAWFLDFSRVSHLLLAKSWDPGSCRCHYPPATDEETEAAGAWSPNSSFLCVGRASAIIQLAGRRP